MANGQGLNSLDAVPETTGVMFPWYRRYTRWRQTSHEEAVNAEERLLSLSGVKLEVADIPVGSKPDEFMHTIAGGKSGGTLVPVVLVPGYGAGIGFFWRNFAALSEHLRLLAVDLLGTGLSGRPPWKARNREETEAFFLDSLAKWRQEMGIDKMVLVGHSMGGYLAASYALQHPDHVQHLILVCPAGISNKPDDWQPPPVVRNPWSLAGQMYRTATRVWDWGVTPGGVIRSMGPWGSGLISGYVRRRFREGMGLDESETAAFEKYFYHIMAARGSGEHALRHLLAPFAWARRPLEEPLLQLRVPVTFIYGEKDWMDPAGAHRLVKQLQAQRQPAGPGDLQVITLGPAGHYVFLDQPEAFLGHMVRICQPYLRGDALKGDSPATFPASARNVRHISPDSPIAADAAKAPKQPQPSGHLPDAAVEGLAKATDL